jgi:hypothetical protein
MASTRKTVKFGNSRVRNQLEHGSITEYVVKTKSTNGPSAISNSALRTNQKANPDKYQWDSSKSYTNTFSLPASNKAKSLANHRKVRQNYGNDWVDATVALNTYKETMAEFNKTYRSKLIILINKNFGNPPREIFNEIVSYLDELNTTFAKWQGKTIGTDEANAKMESIFDSAEEFLQIDKKDFKKLYPEFRDLFSVKLKIMNKAKDLRYKTLKGLRNARTLKNSKAR